MNAALLSALACGLLLSATGQAHATAGESRPLSQERETAIYEAFFTERNDAVVLREAENVEAAWEMLAESEREMLSVDCVAALEVGADVHSAGSATGDVGELPEVEEVDEDIRNEMESEEAAAGTQDPLTTTGPQRRVLLAVAVPTEAWVELCNIVVDLD
jgi:hypothetical protein